MDYRSWRFSAIFFIGKLVIQAIIFFSFKGLIEKSTRAAQLEVVGASYAQRWQWVFIPLKGFPVA